MTSVVPPLASDRRRVGTSRIGIGVPYATDVLGGFARATVWQAASLAVARTARPPHLSRS